VLCLTVSACRCTRCFDTAPVLSDRVVPYPAGRRLGISLGGCYADDGDLMGSVNLCRVLVDRSIHVPTFLSTASLD
jgi:hypothetical protein